MKKFSDILSPVSWLLIHLFAYPTWFLIFRPSLAEAALLIAVDIAALVIIQKATMPRFFRENPWAVYFFDGVDFAAVAGFDLVQKTELFAALVKFPLRRARFVLVWSLVKILPGLAVIILVWNHGKPMALLTVLALTLNSVFICYFFVAVFTETHILASAVIAELHSRFDLTEVFRRANHLYVDRDPVIFEILGMVCFWLFVLGLQAAIILQPDHIITPGRRAVETIVVGILGLSFFARIWYLNRQQVRGGLVSIFNAFNAINQVGTFPGALPLHSSPLLARFEMTYNSLTERLKKSQDELSNWIFRQTEVSRYRALGEISGLVVHDLSGPLHVINFCVQQLRENPDLIHRRSYIDNLSSGVRTSIGLIDSLKTYLKSTPSTTDRVAFKEAFNGSMRILETQFHGRGFRRIEFAVDSLLSDIRVNCSKADLIHILLNLFANSAENLLVNNTESPRVLVTLLNSDHSLTLMSIYDNGTGLSKSHYENFTSFHYAEGNGQHSAGSLGLRLVRRLVERWGGSLEVIDPQSSRPGTEFVLTLRSATTEYIMNEPIPLKPERPRHAAEQTYLDS